MTHDPFPNGARGNRIYGPANVITKTAPSYTYDLGIVIGRFQPPHKGHLNLFDAAFEKSATVLIIIGSAKAARTPKNPWTALEREVMIRETLTEDQRERVIFAHVRDYWYNHSMWLSEVQAKVYAALQSLSTDDSDRLDNERFSSICLFGHRKDRSSAYIDDFPQWEKETLDTITPLNATDIRNAYFAWHGKELHTIFGHTAPMNEQVAERLSVPLPVADMLWAMANSDTYVQLAQEHEHYLSYRHLWQGPYPVQFITTDCVVVQSGHVLLIKRKFAPGKGLWALPGGFVHDDESLVDGAVRELREETKIELHKKTLLAHLVNNRVFDHPGRSLRGRTITHAFYFDLGSGNLPYIKGSDDALKAVWVPLYDVMQMEDKFFEDHHSIIMSFIAGEGR